MGVVGEVVHGGPVAEVDVIDHAEALEIVEESVDGGFVHVGLAGLHGRRELLGRGVFAVTDEGLEDRPAGARHPAAVRPQEREHPLQSVCSCRVCRDHRRPA